ARSPVLPRSRRARGAAGAVRARDGAVQPARYPEADPHARERPRAGRRGGPRGGRRDGGRQWPVPREPHPPAALIALLVGVVLGLAWVAAAARRRAAGAHRRLEAAARELEALQHAFARFAPAQVVEDIIAGGMATRSESKEVTVLFADLQG